MELNVGDYVRTKYGEICKLKKSRYNYLLYSTDIEIDRHNDRDCNDYGFDSDTIKDIIKSSPNIIDVLEEHDFVRMEDRGNRFYEIEKDYTGKLSLRDIGWDEYEELDETNIPEIVSIITHEQMEQMQYVVGDN